MILLLLLLLLLLGIPVREKTIQYPSHDFSTFFKHAVTFEGFLYINFNSTRVSNYSQWSIRNDPSQQYQSMFVQSFKYALLLRLRHWLRRWTKDQGVWGSIPVVLVMCTSVWQALNLRRLWPPSSNGYQVEQKLVVCEWFQLQKMCCILPREMRLWKSEFQYYGGNSCEVRLAFGDIGL